MEVVGLTKPGAFVPPSPREDPAVQRKLQGLERQLEVPMT